MRRLSLLQQFSLFLFITLVIVGVFWGNLLTHFMKKDMLNRSSEILASFVQKEIRDNLDLSQFVVVENEQAYADQARQIASLNLGQDVVRVKIWDRNKKIVWSSQRDEIGEHHPDHHELTEVLNGETLSEITSKVLAKKKYAYEIEDELMELYIPFRAEPTGKIDFVFELYKNIDRQLAHIAQHNRLVWLATFGGACFLYFVLFVIVWRASRHMAKQSRQIAVAKNEWEETFDTINDAITIHDSDFNIIRANKAAERILGLSLHKILKQKCFFSYHGTENPPLACPSCMTARTGEESITEMYEPHLDKFIEIKALPRYNKQKELIGVVHVVRDITDQKKAEEQKEKLQVQLNQVQKMESVGKLAGGIAHDFNNMLSAIIGYSELALNSLPDGDERLRDDILTIKESGEKAAELTRQLLAFSRKQLLNSHPLDLNSVIEGMVKMLSRVMSEEIQLDLKLDQGISNVVADGSQMEQVLLNLAVNARDAMPSGGKLLIETKMVEFDKDYIKQHAETKPGKHVLLAVTDTGIGMPEEVRQQIFEPFFTTKDVGKGTGLGLATVYGIVKQHGGNIYVYSEPAQGTTFKIYLPATAEEQVEEPEEIYESIPPGKETVLLVEDDKTIRNMIKSVMETEGYTILEAGNGLEAMDVSNKHSGEIQLLLTDVIMPKMNGRELAATLQQKRPDMKIIFMSGYTDEAISQHGILEPGVHFIQKPITPSVLARKLKEVMDMH